jgi:catechol 2,3-dioxygenase-like lactoylglutathione lyase family enzyme
VVPAEEDAMFAYGNVSDEVSDIRSRIERVDDDGDRIAFIPKFVDHGNERCSRSFDPIHI